MYYYGSFLTRQGETVTVHIVTDNNRAKQVEIGDDGSGIFFTDDPVEIRHSVNDTFDHLLRSQATIRLLTRDFVKDFFCTSCMDAVVNIYRGDRCIFAGFIEPQAYSQGYNEVYDELELTCIDALSALQYSKYRNVGSLGVLYEEVKASAGMRTFHGILADMIAGVCSNLDITGKNTVKCHYDGSKSMTAVVDRYLIFKQIAVSELLFLKEEEDNVWTNEKVLTEMLRYLNLHMVQSGFQFYIFSWETLKGSAPMDWQDLLSESMHTTPKQVVEISVSNVAGTDTNISIGEVFNQILVTCNTESMEKLIESPLDESDLTSPYTNRQKYMTEYSSDGEGEQAYAAFYDMTHGRKTSYGGATITDWYVQVRNNPKWTFPEAGSGVSLIDKWCHDNANQHMLPYVMTATPAAALLALGKIDRKDDLKDNSPIPRIDMSNYLVISVNGNRKTDSQTTYPNADSLLANAPLAVYNGNVAGGVYSPSDDETTNYIVLSGKLVMNPVMDFTQPYKTLHDAASWDEPDPQVWHKTVPSRNNGDGRYYTQQYFKADTPAAPAVWNEIPRSLIPFTGTGPQEFEFKYSAADDPTDRISKVPVLACMLIIGDKCLVETGMDGKVSDFKWMKYKKREQCANDAEYYKQCFTIGIDPKIGDKLVGTEFDLQNNIDYAMGIDAEGMAIPIKKSDKLSGAVRFMILGPVNLMWNGYIKPGTVFFQQGFLEYSVPLMAAVSSIFIKSFEMKIYSDNGLVNNLEEDDIVYMSDTREAFVNRKDDISFEICSALTLSERQRLGAGDAVGLSTALAVDTGNGVLTIYDYNKQLYAKPEQSYVDSYYKECHKPRVLMVHRMEDRDGLVDLFSHYVHPALGKEFYVQGISRNLIEGSAELTLKEVWND